MTISNLGSLYRGQSGYGTLIEIVPPQVCAFALGAVQDKPVVVTDKFGNKTIEARQILPITVVFDHRALDFGDAEEMAKMGERGNIAPLPDPSETTPNIFIKASADAQPVGAAEIANPLEVA